MRAVPGVSGSVREAAGGETAAGRVHPLQQDEHDENAEALRKEPVEMMEKIKWGTMVERGRVTEAADGNATVESCDRPGVVMQCGTLDSVTAGDIVYCWTFPDGRGIVLARVDTDATLIPAEDREKIEKLQVGARNLLRFSLNPTITFTGGSGGYQRKQTVAEWGCTNAFRVYGTSGSSRAFYIGGLTATIANGKNVSESGQSYAMSVWVKNAHAANSVIVCTPLGGERTLAPGESARCAFVVEGDGLNNLEIDFKPTAPPSEYDVYFWHPKIEIGTVATDWLPAPEDADESYVASTGKPTENQTPGFGETVEVSQVKTDSGGRVTNLTARTIKIPDSAATQSAAGLMSASDKKRLDELEVGGRNLLLYSAEPIVYSAYSTINVTRNISVPEWGATDATRVAGGGGSNMYVCRVGGNTEDMAYGKNVGVNGKNYTISVWIKNNHATNRCGVRINLPYDPGYTMLNPGESMRVEQTAVGNGSTVLCIYFRTGNLGEDFDFSIWHPKIEEGTFATDWTPAVEDYAGEASVTFSSRRNTTNTSAASGTLRRVGKTVNLIFSATLANALAASTWLTIGTLPSGYLPTENIYTSAVWIGGTVAQVYIGTAIQVWSPQAQGAGAVVRGSVTWFAA